MFEEVFDLFVCVCVCITCMGGIERVEMYVSDSQELDGQFVMSHDVGARN